MKQTRKGIPSVEAAVLTPRELAIYLKRSESSLYRDLAMGKLPPSIKLGNSHRWLKNDIDAWLDAGAPSAREWLARRKAR